VGLFHLSDDLTRTMSPEIVGREEELASLRTLVEPAEGGPAAVVLEGEPGIGKSTLWLAGVEEARERDFRVLSSRPAEAERGLAHAGLGDLFDGVLEEALPALTPPRRRALEIALLVEEASGDPVDRRALAVAVRGALQALSRREPLVIAIDDVQWLDSSSTSALAFALRRLDEANVRLLLARRLADDTKPSELELAFGVDNARLLRVGPLSVGALHRLLRDRLDRTFPRQTLLRIHERSGGNPFFALEVARVLEGDVDPLEPLPVPETLDELVRARVSGLPDATRDALGIASAWGTSSESLLERIGVEANALDPAVDLHVIERASGTIRFTHPLLSSALYADLGEKRRDIHARIAQVVDDPVFAARHLALSKAAPDEVVAADLDHAVRLAADRGASAVAAELAEQAVRLTPRDSREEHHRRALGAARAHQAAGEWTRARAIASDLLGEAESGSLRAEVLILLSELESVDRSIQLLEDALREADARPALQSAVHCRLAWAARFNTGFDHAHAALVLADELGDHGLQAHARAVQGILSWFTGDAEAPEDLPALARDFPAAVGGERLVREGTQAVANTFSTSSNREAARELLEGEYREWRERDERRSGQALWGLAWVEFWAGRWELAAQHAERAYDISIQYGLEVPQDHLPIAVIAVHRGQLELARSHSLRALDLAEEQFVARLHPPQHMAVIGLAALWGGKLSTAEQWLDKATRRAFQMLWREPSVRWWSADHAELLLELGRIDEAAEIVDTWEDDAARVGREWVFGHATRSRGLIAVARKDVDRAEALFQEAVEQHDEVGDLYGRSRALFALGVVRRRLRQKRASREALGAALEGFEQLGAMTWVERTRSELGSIGGRQRQDGLTPAERRVAALVAEGRTNREVAAALFLGERTVSSHLTHIYAKLGIRSRTELARHLN
jgi:DNA-binding CsgD family transcriptional regulator